MPKKGWVARYKEQQAKPPPYFKHRLAFAPEYGTMPRRDLFQISYERSLRYEKIRIPMSADVVSLLKHIFSDCDKFVRWAGLKVELSTYILDVQIARSGFIDKRGNVQAAWTEEFISIPNPNGLSKSTPRQLWIAFEEYAIAKVDNYEYGSSLVKSDIVSVSKSDPVFIRPARVRIFAHGKRA